MVDFEKATRDLEEKRGYCILPIRVYLKGTVIGRRTKNNLLNLGNSILNSFPVDLHWTIEDRGLKYQPDKLDRVICFSPGVTGWESYSVDTFMYSHVWDTKDDWAICAGTFNRWDRLVILHDEALKIRNTLIENGYV